MAFGEEGINFRIPGDDCVTLNACSRSPAVNKYLHMKTKEKKLNVYTKQACYTDMNIPRSKIQQPKQARYT